MNREEEIMKKSVAYNEQNGKLKVFGGSAILSDEEYFIFNKNPDFIAGAQWADEHPRSDLVSMEFACKYWETILTSWGVDRHNILLALDNFSHAVKLENENNLHKDEKD